MTRTVLALLATAGMCSVSLAQHDQPTKQPAKPGMPKTTTPAKPETPAGQPGQPGGMSPEDMQKMMDAYTQASKPGKMHEWLQHGVGTWQGQVKSYEVPGQPPTESTCTTVITSMMDGRFTRGETHGEMEMMGQKMNFEGFAIYGFDNATNKFEQTWVDNMGTGMLQGTGELSADGKVLTWNMHCTDPMTKKPMNMREVETRTGENAMVLEMYGPNPMDPAGKEYKMMEITFTRKAGAAPELKKPEARRSTN